MPIRKVLMVDDEPDIRTIGQMSLQAIGKWQTVTADSGATAIAIADREQPDVILLDVMMPGMDGTATLALLQAQPSTRAIPVIFMTAKVQKHEIERYLELGAAGVIRKPFDPVTLPDEIRALVNAPTPAQRSAEIELAALRADYARRVPEKLRALAAAIQGARENSSDPAFIVEARSLAHRLAGTAGSYGLGEISDAVGSIEVALRDLDTAPLEDNASLWQRVAEVLERATAIAARAGSS